MGEKDTSTSEEDTIPLKDKIIAFFRNHWPALLFAVIIAIITIVVVPIVYSIKTNTNSRNNTNFAWNVSATTVFSRSLFQNRTNQTLGLISSMQFVSLTDLYILEKDNHRFWKYSTSLMNLSLIGGSINSLSGSDLTLFNSPNDFIIHSTDNNKIYIADTFNHRILIWDEINKRGTVFFGKSQSGSGLDELNTPMSITIDQSSMMYIADYGNNRIVSVATTGGIGKSYLGSGTGERNTFVLNPISIKYDKYNDSLVIAQETGYNVVRWNKNAPSWSLIAGSASSELNGTSRTLFNKLCQIAVDGYGHTYVNDCQNQRIQFFNGDLQKGRTIAGVIQARGNNSYTFDYPTAMTLDLNANLYVADSRNYRIQSFKTI